MENTTNKNLSFGQKNWFLLCVLVAIISPLIVHLLQTGARKESIKQSMDIHSTDSSKTNDSSYHVASPPQNQKTDSAAH